MNRKSKIATTRSANGTQTDVSEQSQPSELGHLLDACLAAFEAGRAIDVDALAAAHPAIADQLPAYLAVLRVAGQLDAQVQAESDGGVEGRWHLGLEGGAADNCLGDFRILRVLGRGGMGIVFEAEQISLRRRVALKVLPFAATLDSQQLRRFEIEAQAAAQLHDTNIMPIFSVGCERGVHYYAMQYIKGQSLAAVIHDRKRPTADGQAPRDFFRTVARLGMQAAEALDHAHRQGIIHRDIKPANLLLDVRGNLWITDFGLARMQTDSTLTLTGDVSGYFAPYQPRARLAPAHGGRPPHRHLLAGRDALRALDASPGLRRARPRRIAAPDDVRRAEAAAVLEPGDPPRPGDDCAQGTRRHVQNRYASALDLADDLRRFLEDRPIKARRPSVWKRAEMGPARTRRSWP